MRLGRRGIGAATGLAIFAFTLWALRPWGRESRVPRAEGVGAPRESIADAPAHLDPGAARPETGTGRGRASGRVSVEIDVRTEDGVPASLFVYAGTKENDVVERWRVASGEPKIVEVPERCLHWQTHVANDDPSAEVYEHSSVRLDSLKDGSRVSLRVPRARGTLEVRARDDAGEPVAGVVLELSVSSEPERTRRTTAADGRASWQGIRGMLFSTSGVHVVEVPAGYRLRAEPTLVVARETSPDRAVGTAEILLDECTAGFDVDLADARLAWGFLERRAGASWEKVLPRPYLEIDPAHRMERPLFVHDGSPRAGRLRGRNLRAGEHRLTVVGGGSVLGIATVVLSAREVTVVSLPPLETVRLAGRVVGPARGMADLLNLRILGTVGNAAPLAGETLALLVRSDGTFEALLPVGVERIAIAGPDTSAEDAPTSWVVVPSVRAAGTGLEVESLRPARIRGRLVDGKGRGLENAGVWATLATLGRQDRDFLAGALGIRGGPTKADGSFRVGPGCPGTWSVHFSVKGRPTTSRDVVVHDGADDDLGDIVLE